MDAQLKKGVLSIAVLKILEKEDRYGYDIVMQLTGLFPGRAPGMGLRV